MFLHVLACLLKAGAKYFLDANQKVCECVFLALFRKNRRFSFCTEITGKQRLKNQLFTLDLRSPRDADDKNVKFDSPMILRT